MTETTTPRRIRWGGDDMGHPLFQAPLAADIFRELGMDLVIHHVFLKPSLDENAANLKAMDEWSAQHGVEWVANMEHSNWQAAMVDEDGHDWFNRPDGRHFFLFPDRFLKQLAGCRALLGVMYDEASHMQNCANQHAEGIDKPFFYNPAGREQACASDEFTEAARTVHDLHAAYGIPLYTEEVFPVLFHNLSAAGFTVATKILKENWSGAFIAAAMGAALQYNRELWITPDLWMHGDYPGHSVDTYRSSLLLAYWMGADCIYTEALAFDLYNRGTGSLVLIKDGTATLTEFGVVARWFWKEYVPAHPRPYTFRDLRPTTAIIRREDGCWGQGSSGLPDRLFGSSEWKSDRVTESWLRAWHLLSQGNMPAFSLSWHSSFGTYQPYRLFAPLNGVVVYDDHVGADRLAGIDLLVLTGQGISESTLAAVRERVAAGATCVALPHLVSDDVRRHTGTSGTWQEGLGQWVVSDDLLDPHIRRAMVPYLCNPNESVYRFGKHQVSFSVEQGDPNRLAVTIKEV